MTQQNQNKQMSKGIYFLLLIPALMFGFIGGLLGLTGEKPDPLSGFLWGVGIGIAICAISFIGIYGWDWIKKEVDKGRLLPFIIVGLAAAIAVSSYLAFSLGNATCVESDVDNRGSSCVEYADDGYEATSEQKWDKFWSTLPITVIIASLVAVIVRNQFEKNKKK